MTDDTHHDDTGVHDPDVHDTGETDDTPDATTLNAGDAMPPPAERIDELEQQIAEKDQLIRDLEQREQIGNLLREADAIDVDAARLLTEATLAAMDQPDIERAVADLRRTKPYLFRVRSRPVAGQSPRGVAAPSCEDRAAQAASEAAVTGHRRDLLRYLRMRREARG
jgi:hypothetical protein